MQQFDLLCRTVLVERQFCVRELLAERAERSGDDIAVGCGTHHPDREPPDLSLSGPSGRRYRLRRLGQDRPHPVQKHRTRLGQLDPPLRPPEQLHSENSLKVLNLLTQRWLRNADPLRGAPEMQLLRHSNEVTQKPQLDAANIQFI